MRWGPILGAMVAASAGLATGAYAAWTPMGPAPIAQSSGSSSYGHADVAVAGGVPHIAYDQQTFTTSNGLSFRRADPAGGAAVTVPAPAGTGFSRLPRLAASGSDLHAAWIDETNHAEVATWNGTSWSGVVDLHATFDLSADASDLDIAAIAGRPWIAWTDGSSVLHVAERVGATWERRASPDGNGAVKHAPRLAAGADGVPLLADWEADSTGDHVEVWRYSRTDDRWVAHGSWSESVDGIATAPATLGALDLTAVGTEAVVAFARSDALRVFSSTGGGWSAQGGTVATGGIGDVSVRRTGGDLAVAYGQSGQARVSRRDPLGSGWSTVLGSLNGFAAPSTAASVTLADADGVPVVGFTEAKGTASAVRLHSFVPALATTRTTATPDSVSLFVTPDLHGFTLPVALQREGAAPEQVRAAGSAEVGWTVGGLAPETEVRWRPVLAHGPFVRGGSFLSARSAAAPPAPPTTGSGTPPEPPPPTVTQPAPPPPPPSEPDPTLGKTAAVDAVQGKVVVTRPGGKPQTLGSTAGLLPIGTRVDVTRGRVELWFDTPNGKGQNRGVFYQGTFRIQRQDRKTGLVTFQLERPTQCASAKRGARAARKKKNKLWGNAKGRFRTKGKFAAATVRGTTWSTEDACDRTTVAVVDGTVDAEDLLRKRTTRLKAGRSYTARRR